MKTLIHTFEDTPVYFDTDTGKFSARPGACRKDREAQSFAAIKMEIRTAIKKQNAPKRTKTEHPVRIWWKDQAKVWNTEFKGYRCKNGYDNKKGWYFRDAERQESATFTDYYTSGVHVVPNYVDDAGVERLEAAFKAIDQAKKAYEAALKELTVKVSFPSVCYDPEPQQLNEADRKVVLDMAKAATYDPDKEDETDG